MSSLLDIMKEIYSKIMSKQIPEKLIKPDLYY